MKVINLLNKIANGEKVPKKIKYLYYEYEFNEKEKEYQRCFNGLNYGLGEDRRLDIILDEPIEILEESKGIPEKLDWSKNDFTYPEGNLMSEETADMLIEMQDKINEIIDYLESKGE